MTLVEKSHDDVGDLDAQTGFGDRYLERAATCTQRLEHLTDY